jgi:hypothetical protein
MKTLFMITLLTALLSTLLFAQMGDQINVYKIDVPPAMDGDVSDWDEGFNVGGFESFKNVCYAAPTNDSWKGFDTDYQANIFLAHDGEYIYLGWECTVDDVVLQGTKWGGDSTGDNIKVCFGSTQDNFYLWNNPLESGLNPKTMSYPYNLDEVGVTVADEPGELPVYEARIMIMEIPRYTDGTPPSVNVNFMTEDYDAINDSGASTMDYNYVGLGLNYPENLPHYNIGANPWENPLYYPNLSLLDEYPPGYTPSSVKSELAQKNTAVLRGAPNPFASSIDIQYNIKGKGTLKIYNADGQMVHMFSQLKNSGVVSWNGRSESGASLAGGVYFARLTSGSLVQDMRMLLVR